LAISKPRERLSVSKRATEKCDVQRFFLKNMYDAKVEDQYQANNANRFAAFENLDDILGINRDWKNIRKNVEFSARHSLGHYKLKQDKTRFDENVQNYYKKGNRLTCSGCRIQAK
jgi:hypothetical protein